MKYRLRHPHTHAGKEYAVGDEIEIDQATADWLDQRHAERELTITTTTTPVPAGAPEGGESVRPVATTDGKVIPPTLDNVGRPGSLPAGSTATTLGNTARPVTTEERKK